MAIRGLLSRLKFKNSKGDKEFKDWIKNTTGLVPSNLTLYHQAFSHSSVASRKGQNNVSNERLEFLGDAVLGSIIAEHLFKLYPYKDEGFLTQLRSKIVNGHIDALSNTNEDYKSQLQIYCQKKKVPLEYRLLSEKRVGANKLYTIQVFINGVAHVKFENHSKRTAEQKAAQLTLEQLDLENG